MKKYLTKKSRDYHTRKKKIEMRTWDEKRERRQRKDKATARKKERKSGPVLWARETGRKNKIAEE